MAPGPIELIIILVIAVITLGAPLAIGIAVLVYYFGSKKQTCEVDGGLYTGLSPMEEGKAAGESLSVVRILEHRFSQCPETLRNRIEAVTETERLEKLLKAALDCRSLDEFEAGL